MHITFGDKLLTPPTERVVSQRDVREFLRVDSNESDVELERLIDVATERCQQLTRRQFLTATRQLSLDCWPRRTIHLPWPRLQTGVILRYYDVANVLQTLTQGTHFFVDLNSEPGRLTLASTTNWPELHERPGAIQIVYDCGWDSVAEVPEAIKHAVMMSVGHLFEFRGEVSAVPLNETPAAVQHLLTPWIVGDEFIRYGGGHYADY